MLYEILAIVLSIFVLLFIPGLIRGVYFYTLLKRETSVWEFITWDVDIYYRAVKPLRNQLIVMFFTILFYITTILILIGVAPINKYIAIEQGKEITFLILLVIGLISGLLTLSRISYLINYLQHRLQDRSYLIKMWKERKKVKYKKKQTKRLTVKKENAIVLLLVCFGLFLTLTALGCFQDYFKLRHVLYGPIFLIGIFSFSSGIHKLKLEILDILMINISSVAITLYFFNLFLDYWPQTTFLYTICSFENLLTLLIISIIFGGIFFILDYVEVYFLMDKIRLPPRDKTKNTKLKIEDLFPHLKLYSILSLYLIRPSIFWSISVVVPGFSVNLLGALVGVLVIHSFIPRWTRVLSKLKIITHEKSYEELEETLKHFCEHPDHEYSVKPSVKIYSNERYGFSIKYPSAWAIKILEPEPNFSIKLNVWFGIEKEVHCSIMAGPIGPTIYGKTLHELENRARLHRQNSDAHLISSKNIRIEGIEAYEHVYSANNPTRYAKQVGFFKDDDEYLLMFMVGSESDFKKCESIFDACIRSFKFTREVRKQEVKKKDNIESWDISYR